MIDISTKIAKHTGNQLVRLFEACIYAGRWLCAPMYVGLLCVLAIYVYKFGQQLLELLHTASTIDETRLMVVALTFVDVTMVGHLIIMIITGSYSIFVKRFEVLHDEDRPQWLDKITAGTLKVKMATSLIGVSSIHLLKDFIDAEKLGWELIYKHALIHGVFLASTIALAMADKLSHSQSSDTAKETSHH